MRRTKRGGWPYSQPPNVQFEANRASPQSKGLVAWWPLWEAGYATSPPRWTLTPHGTPDRVISTRGPAVSLAMGSNEYLDLATPVVTDHPVTITTWYKAVNTTIWDVYSLLGISDASAAGEGWEIVIQTRGAPTTIMFYAWEWALGHSSNAVSPEIAGLSDWIHITAVFRSSTWRAIYVNGIQEDTDNGLRDPDSANLDVTTIGAWQSDGGVSNYTQGYLSDSRIYNVAKTAAEVYQMYAEPRELYKPLIRRWLGWKSPVVERIPRYGFTNFQVPGIV